MIQKVVVWAEWFVIFDRNKKLIQFTKNLNGRCVSVIENEVPSTGDTEDLCYYVMDSPRNNYIMSDIPAGLKKRTELLMKHQRCPVQPIFSLEVLADDVLDTTAYNFLMLGQLKKKFKPLTWVGKETFEEWFHNPTTDTKLLYERHDLLERVIEKKEAWITIAREHLKKLVLPRKIGNLADLQQADTFMFQLQVFAKTFLPAHFSLLGHKINSEIYKPQNAAFRKKVEEDFQKGEIRTAVSMLRPDYNEELVQILTRRTQIENHFQMLVHDLKRRLRTPDIEYSSRLKVLVLPRTTEALLQAHNVTVTKYTKQNIYATTVEFEELLNSYEQLLIDEQEFSHLVFASFPKPKLDKLKDMLGRIDTVFAYAFFVVEQGSVWSKPGFVGNAFKKIILQQVYHPFITECVKNDISVETRTALINGFNSSGKSTMLRTIGLCAFLAQIGMYVPATSALLPPFDKIFCRYGTDDELTAGNSTFTLQMVHISNILLKVTSSSLVLIDEICSNTNADEGSALALSITNHLSHTVGNAFITTHYKPEEFLKLNTPIQFHSMTPNHKLLDYKKNLSSNGWDYCLRRGYVQNI